MTAGQHPARVGRRALLGGGASLLAAASAGLTGCEIDTSTGTGSASDATIDFPDFATTVEESGTLSWLDSGDLKSVFETAVLRAFSSRHPKINNKYQGAGWETVQQVLSVGMRNESAPDVFALPPNNSIPAQTAIDQGWVQPIEDLIPDFAGWRKNWPQTALIPGIHIFNDKLYNFPLNSGRRLDKMLFLDSANMQKADYTDPAQQIKTWDDIYQALKRAVAAGTSGLMLARDGLAATVSALATSIGWKGMLGGSWSGIDFSTGRYSYDAPQIVEAFEFLHKLVKDKLVVPGFLTLAEKDAREQFAAGRNAMMFAGPYSLPAWKEKAPDWKYAVAQLPSRDGSDYVVPFAETGANSVWVYAKTDVPKAVGQVLAYMGSPEGQKQSVIMSQGNLESRQPDANTAAGRETQLDPNATFCSQLAHRIMRAGPQIELRNSDAADVQLAYKPPAPLWPDLMQGIFTGDLRDPQAQFTRFTRAMESALDAAITAAAKRGSSVTRDDFVFPNWDRHRDYSAQDYKEL